ncbi:ABC transporter ATP-binding protein [Burkholderia sp. MR1-5-21]
MAKITLSQVKKSFASTDVIKGIDLEITDREFVVFVGPSGCGKSTLLRMIAGLEDISGGTVAIDGKVVNDLSPADRQIAMVFQSYALYPHKTVRENMGFGLKMAKVDNATIQRKVLDAAKVLQLEHLLDRRPKELSGGQRQRVAIGRAIVRNPRLFLFDEPLSNLDAALRGQMRIEIARLHQTLDATMIYVTHDQVEAMTLADKIVVLNGGRIEQVGSPMELYNHPRNLFVAGFIGSPKMNFLKARVLARLDDRIEVALGDGVVFGFSGIADPSIKKGGTVTLGVRPDRLVSEQYAITLPAEVLVVERLGSETQVVTRLQSGENVIAVLEGTSKVKVGDVLKLRISAGHCHLFNEEGLAVTQSNGLANVSTPCIATLH